MSRPPRTVAEALAKGLGVTEARAKELLRGMDAEAVEATDAQIRAEAELSDLAAVESLKPWDVERLGRTDRPLAALSAEVSERSDRHLTASLAAHASWARTEDPSERTRPAREAFDARFEREVDPDGKLSREERSRRAAHARKAYFLRLALKSAQARRGKA